MQTEELKKQDGMIQAASASRRYLEKARDLAESIGKRAGFCSIEDVRLCWDEWSFPTGNWTGSIFKDASKWEFSNFIKAMHDGSHSRRVIEWKWIGGE